MSSYERIKEIESKKCEIWKKKVELFEEMNKLSQKLEEYDKDPEKYKRKKILKSTLGMGAMMAGSYGLTDYFLNKALGRGQRKKEIALAAGIGGLGGAATGYLAAKTSNKNVEDYSKDPQFAYRKALYGKEK